MPAATGLRQTAASDALIHHVGEIAFPDIVKPLFRKSRYKVMYSGRGACKSWSFARMALIRGMLAKERILCMREIQRSIKDSIHKLLKDQIELLGLSHFYTVTDNDITGANGTEFIFAGLSNQTATSLKSYENVTICLIDEGQDVAEYSWRILLPTIRAPGSEVWIGMNPQLPTNPAWKRFVVNPPPNSIVIETNWRYNPWFSTESEELRQYDFNNLPKEDYENIWEGKCRLSVEGAIYPTEIMAVVKDNRFNFVPYDPRLKVHTIWDFGWNDATAIILCQVVRNACYIIDYLEGRFRTDDWWASHLNAMRLNWGKDWIPHDGEHHDHKVKSTTREILMKMGRTVAPLGSVPGPSVITREQGIMRTRALFPRLVFNNVETKAIDHPAGGYQGVPRLVECLKHYRRNVPKTTNEPAEPFRDEFCHGADALRHLALCVDKMDNESDAPRRLRQPYESFDPTMGILG